MSEEDEDIELQRLRMKRMSSILKQKQIATQQAQRKIPTIEDKIDMIIQVLLAPNALQYLQLIKQRNEQAYQRIRQLLFPPKIMTEIDMLLHYLRQGMIRRGVVSLIEIQQLERKVLGIGSTITIKKQGQESKSIGSYLKDEE